VSAGRNKSNLLLIAAREPKPGVTKTRLGAAIGAERAAHLYQAFLTDLAMRFTPRPETDVSFDLGWAFTPPECDFRQVLTTLGCPPPDHVRFIPQVGRGWDARQANLLRWGHDQGYERTVLIASDSPHLPRSITADAFAVLCDHDVVIGRVRDGGYYLIGLSGFQDVLSGVPMSTAHAADALAARAQCFGLRVTEVSPTFDIDEVDDLELLRDALAPVGAAAPATWMALRELGLTRRSPGPAGQEGS
jgi:glycosyltransferase A (GT-A) superfamily protein (DUF2064 family)